ncbi:hypothetical protein [Geodermatophilus sp. SYSU D01176]
MVSATVTRPADQVATCGYPVDLVERYSSCVDDLEGLRFGRVVVHMSDGVDVPR